MLITEPLESIDVHNMRENPSLVPKKMVAFKINPQIKGGKKLGQSTLSARRSPNVVESLSAECRQGRVTP